MAYARERTGPEAASFGKLIRAWRGPDPEDWLRAAERAGARLGIDTKKPEAFVEALDAVNEMPFRTYQSLARRFKVRTWSLRRLSEELGISKNTLEDYERGRHYPPVEFVYDLAVVLGRPSHELVSQWFRHHPNSNVQAAENPLARAVAFFRGGPRELQRYRKDATVQFLMAAFIYGLKDVQPPKLTRAELSRVVTRAALIIDHALRLGLDPHPESVAIAQEHVAETTQDTEHDGAGAIAPRKNRKKAPAEQSGTEAIRGGRASGKPKRGRLGTRA